MSSFTVVPSPPTGLLVTIRTDDALTVTWIAPGSDRFTGYTIRVSEGETLKTQTPSKDSTSVEIAGLTAGIEYSVEIVTVNNLDESPVLTCTASTCKSPFLYFPQVRYD